MAKSLTPTQKADSTNMESLLFEYDTQLRNILELGLKTTLHIDELH